MGAGTVRDSPTSEFRPRGSYVRISKSKPRLDRRTASIRIGVGLHLDNTVGAILLTCVRGWRVSVSVTLVMCSRVRSLRQAAHARVTDAAAVVNGLRSVDTTRRCTLGLIVQHSVGPFILTPVAWPSVKGSLALGARVAPPEVEGLPRAASEPTVNTCQAKVISSKFSSCYGRRRGQVSRRSRDLGSSSAPPASPARNSYMVMDIPLKGRF